jgi:hypothetical protein
MREAITLSILAAVFLASVLNQLPIRAWQRLVAQWDPWTFLPFWGFFGPNPAYAGVHFIYRDRHESDWTRWNEIVLPSSTGWRWLWNPTRHERKALHDLLNGLALAVRDLNDPDKVLLSKCHLALLCCVVDQPAIAGSRQTRQFALVETVGHGSARQATAVYISREFSLD